LRIHAALSPRIIFRLAPAYIYLTKEMQRPFVSHVEAVVASNHYSLGTHLANHELHHGFRVHERVERETLQIFTWKLRESQFLYLWPNRRAMVNASHQQH
jgi:hypothetical protein